MYVQYIQIYILLRAFFSYYKSGKLDEMWGLHNVDNL